MAKFFRLLDKDHRDTVIKVQEDGRHYRYDRLKGWKQTSLFLFGYLYDESDTYDMYEEISSYDAVSKYGVREEDAMDILAPKARVSTDS